MMFFLHMAREYVKKSYQWIATHRLTRLCLVLTHGDFSGESFLNMARPSHPPLRTGVNNPTKRFCHLLDVHQDARVLAQDAMCTCILYKMYKYICIHVHLCMNNYISIHVYHHFWLDVTFTVFWYGFDIFWCLNSYLHITFGCCS